jgi:16S rRNA (guanine966-N2)-methyltransferase
MRIISGEFRGRSIDAPPGQGTRPMLDRVREALFSTLGPGIEGAFVLDLFAGSGSLGLEAVSRGAAYARLVEADAKVVEVLKGNVAELGVADRAAIVGGSAIEPANWRPPAGEPARWADCVLFDPPYPWLSDERRVELMRTVTRLLDEVLRPGGLLVFHTPRRGVQESDFEARFEPDRRGYGSSALWYLRAEEESDSELDQVEGEA